MRKQVMMNQEVHPLTAAREARNLSQAQLAEEVRLGSRTIWAAEHQRPINAHSRRQLCRYFKKTAPELGLISAESVARKRKQQKRTQPTPIQGISATDMSPIVQYEPVLPQSTATIEYTDTLLARIMTVLYQRQDQSASYDDLQHAIDQEIGRFDLIKQPGDNNESLLSRRDVLVIIVGLPLSLLAKAPPGSTSAIFAEEFLPQCAASITVCWHLMRGNDFVLVEHLLVATMPHLLTLAQQPSRYQKSAAKLASQAYILAGLVAVLQLKHSMAELYCKLSIQYSRIAEDQNLEAAGLKHLAAKYLSAKYPLKTLSTYQEALPLIDNISPLLRSRTYLGLALACSQCGQKQEALKYLALTKETFPEHPEDDPSFLYADCGLSSIHHYEGLMYLEFNQPEKAWNTFAQVEGLKSKIVVPERTIIEIVNCQAESATAERDMEKACACIQTGVAGALRLKSEKRFNDTFTIYRQMRQVWPFERQIQSLAELFQR